MEPPNTDSGVRLSALLGSEDGMKASELIAKLQNLVDAEGDLQVGIFNSEYGSYEDPDGVVAARKLSPGSFGDMEVLGERFIGIR